MFRPRYYKMSSDLAIDNPLDRNATKTIFEYASVASWTQFCLWRKNENGISGTRKGDSSIDSKMDLHWNAGCTGIFLGNGCISVAARMRLKYH